MNILITGAAGFVGKNLTEALKAIRDGKDKTHPAITVDELYLYDIDSPAAEPTVFTEEEFREYSLRYDYHCPWRRPWRC